VNQSKLKVKPINNLNPINPRRRPGAYLGSVNQEAGEASGDDMKIRSEF
jgi:hypothetical protein